MNSDILKKVAERIDEYAAEPVGAITEESKLMADLGIFDMSAVSMIEELEDEFGIEISDAEFVKITTVGDIVRLIEALR